MIREAVCVLALLVGAGQVQAAETPQGSPVDSRIQRVIYNENDVVMIYGAQGAATQIVFAPGEEVLSAASGFSDGWEIVARHNSIHLKPKTLQQEAGMIAPQPGKWDTNLNVTTNLRNYTFWLSLVSGKTGNGGRDPRLAFRVQFTYPDVAAAEAAKAAAEREAKARLSKPIVVRNTNYTMQVGRKAKGIAPTTAYDDGRFTYFRFPNNREIPAVYVVATDGSESLVNAHVLKDEVVVQRVAERFTLRLGDQVVAVFNESFDPDGVPPQDGTTVQGVERVLLQENQ